MFCSQCGASLAEDSKFCQRCGRRIAGADEPDSRAGITAPRRHRTKTVAILALLAAGVAAVVVAVFLGVVLRTGGGSTIEDSKAVVISDRPVSLPNVATCRLPSSFRFTSEWELAADLGTLLGDRGELVDILGVVLDETRLNGSADGLFEAPSHVEMQVRLADVELDLNILPDAMNVRVPASGKLYEGGASEEEVAFAQEVCSDLLDGLRSLDIRGNEEKVDGIKALHVQGDERLMYDLASLLENEGVFDKWISWEDGRFGEGNADDSGRWLLELAMAPERLSLDLWLAQDGLWPVRIEAEGMWEAEGLGEVALTLRYQVTEIEGHAADVAHQ